MAKEIRSLYVHNRLDDIPVKIVIGRFVIPVIQSSDKQWFVQQLMIGRPSLLSGLGTEVLGNLLDASDKPTVFDEILGQSDEEPRDQSESSVPDDERSTPAEQAQLADFYEKEYGFDRDIAIQLAAHSVEPRELAVMSVGEIMSEFGFHIDIAEQVSRKARSSIPVAVERPIPTTPGDGGPLQGWDKLDVDDS